MTIKYFSFICLSFMLIISFSCREEPRSDMIFPGGLERINSDGLVRKVDLEIENKVVFYLDISERSLYLFSGNILDWDEFLKKYPDVSVLIYLSGVDPKGKRTKEKMEEYLKLHKFPYEVILDPEYKLFNLNNLESFPYDNKTDQTYYVKGNKILGISNFGMPNARTKELQRFFGRN